MEEGAIFGFIGLVLCLLVEPVVTGADQVSAEHQLIKTLLDRDKYDPIVRPAANPTDVVNVTVAIGVITIEDVDEKEGVMNTNGWIHQTWTDYRLRWDPEAHGTVKAVRIPLKRLWQPELALYNTAHRDSSYVQGDLAHVLHTGRVDWAPHTRFSTFCALDLARFPFDSQSCTILLGTWSYDISAMQLNIPANRTSPQFLYHGREWEILSVESAAHKWSHGDTSDLFSESGEKVQLYFSVVEVRVDVKRIPKFYQSMMVFPSVVLAFLAIFIFWVPPETGERITMGMVIVVTITLQLLILDTYLPTELGSIPSILMYLTYDLVLVVFVILESIMTLNFYHRDIRRGKVPDWTRRIFLGKLRRLVCMRGDIYNSVPTGDLVDDRDGTADVPADRELVDSTDTPLPRSPTLALEKTLDEIRRFLRMLATRPSLLQGPMTGTSHRQLVLSEWHQLALVMDRLSFWLFLVITLFISIVIYSR